MGFLLQIDGGAGRDFCQERYKPDEADLWVRVEQIGSAFGTEVRTFIRIFRQW